MTTFAPLPEGEYPVILADPPWAYANFDSKNNGAASDHYQCISAAEISCLPVASIANRDSLLFLWATGPKLPQALQVIEAWGFDFVGIAFDWLKTYREPFQIDVRTRESFNALRSMTTSPAAEAALERPNRVKTAWVIPGNMYCGLGFRTRQANELCLLGRRGKGLPKKSSSVLSPVVAQRRKHSQKPEEVYDRIEALVDGPYLELFARQSRPGWTAWGDHVEDVHATDNQKAESDG